MIAIIDYGVGNLFSMCSSLKYIGLDAVITGDPAVVKRCDKLILPGVGAFADAASMLRAGGLAELVIKEASSGKPLLGVCLGMQLLFEKSFEFGEHKGLGLLGGVVAPIKPRAPAGYKIPHIGWNALIFHGAKPPLFKYINEGDHVYFVHSFHAEECSDSLAATTEYGAYLTAAVASGNVFGTQFHPEKSGNVGLGILRAFAEI
ncbi:MAG: imidazole glycerol phosphate synthase subunit HisH [Oscillospiraceae bacterium]|jgi:glutamine amidotransferase|nr:imidazole glycerol phosphate synthase subunit HisH [Oscillospiraceae bacterium]